MHYTEHKSLPIENGQCKLEVPVPSRLSIDSEKLIGYWAKEGGSGIDVPPGDEPLIVKVPVVPAGAICGRVLNTDGSPAVDASISLGVVEKSALVDWPWPHVTPRPDVKGKFMASPLPLGGTYRIVASKELAYVVGPPLKVDERSPIRQLDMQLVEGIMVSGQVLGPDENPVADAPIDLLYVTPEGAYHGRQPQNTDTEGRFRFRNVNPQVPGHYCLQMRQVPNFQSLFDKKARVDGTPITIRLKKGLVATGVVIDRATGYPVPDAEVLAMRAKPRVGKRTYTLWAEGPTNMAGQFRFSNLDSDRYELWVVGAELETKGRMGGLIVTAGQSKPVTLRVKIREGSRLKPRKPPAEATTGAQR
jgi:protocatechuate 3,4-dioxygenase beta subunit